MMNHRWLLGLLAVWLVLASAGAAFVNDADIWTVQMFDPKGDATGGSAVDAAQLSFRFDRAADMLWFRVSVYGKPNPDAFGVQIAFDTDGGTSKAPWWGANKDYRFDRLVTARVTRSGGAYRGIAGVADATGATAGNLTNVSRDTLQLSVERDSFIVGVKRSDITTGTKLNVIAAVGSEREWTDEIPNARSVSIDLAAPRPARGLREIDLARNNLQFPADYQPLADDAPPSLARRGRSTGRAVILIPGVFSGPGVFDPFIARHETEYRFLVVTPPGLNGTRARRMPLESVSWGERPWTRRLERDVLELIRRERLEKPVLVSHGFPGSLAVTAIAANHPDMIGAAIEIAAMPPQPIPAPSDPTGRTLISPEQRIRIQDDYWAPKWFKFVTPETWENNNYPAPMLRNDLDQGEKVRQQIEQTPLPVKIRYLTESNGTDDSAEIARITVPLLAVRPGFSANVLADPVNVWFKTSFVDAWNRYSQNPNVQVTTVPEAAVLVFHDQPKAADEAVIAFLQRIGIPPARR